MTTKKKRRRKKNSKRAVFSVAAILVALIAMIAIALIYGSDNETLVKQEEQMEENASEAQNGVTEEAVSEAEEDTAKETEAVKETEKDSEQSEEVSPKDEETSKEENPSEEPEVADNDSESEQKAESDKTNSMNADGKTWTSFDGFTMGSVEGGTYGSLYTAEQLRALDGTKNGYGQGLNVDENNRPVGSIWLQNDYGKYGAVYIAENSNQIYMTLDEGYENGYTAKILDVFKEKNCSAVFFVTMDYAKKNPDLVKRMIDEGHVVGNHSVNHKSMPTLSLEDASYEITELHKYILDTYGYEMYLFRPPMGEFSEQTLALAQSLGYRTMLWSYAYRDYDVDNQPEISDALSKVTAAKHGGAVYLLHAVSATNTAIMGDVIDDFRNSGYTVGAFPR